ncbi:glycoside hydrolase family 5 protein [Parasediminibacterium paludis]|uniref:Glycoside hydrolase family 5 protein n=1 Tax=Parasediminibacterium paludis TaxID=908966 RepID=A0ABV8PW26_9BACT
MKSLILFVLSLCLYVTASFAQSSVLPFGVALCGAEFGTENLPGLYNKNYIYPQKSEIEYFADKGVALMQLPFRWERIQHELYGPLDVEELTRIKKFLHDCDSTGVAVILNMHNFGRYKTNGIENIIGSLNVPITAFKDVWKKLSSELSGFTNIYGLDIMNEPHDMGPYSWYTTAQEVISAIRQVNVEVPIMVQGESYSNAVNWTKFNDNLKNLYDPSNRIVYNAHCYFDNDNSGRYQFSYDASGVNAQTGVEKVKPFIEWLKDNGKRGFIGEFGVPKDDARWLPMLDNFLKYLTANDISGSYWAAGQWWKSYPLSLHPIGGSDQPQMTVYAKYLQNNTNPIIALSTTVASR